MNHVYNLPDLSVQVNQVPSRTGKRSTPKECGTDFASLSLLQILPLIPVGGRLQMFQMFWVQNITDKWAKQVVSQGYYIPFLARPNLTCQVIRTILPQSQHAVLLEEIQQMLVKNAIEEVNPQTPGFYSTFFLVPKKDGGQRPVLNLKRLNKFVQVKSFKMQTLQLVLAQLHQGDWLASLDLKDAYFHVPVHPDYRKYMRFEFLGNLYQFKVLPFGLSTAPRVFTKILAPVIGLLHQKGIYIYPYLDDCLIVAKSKHMLQRALITTQEVLMQAGFVINFKKSHLSPVQRLKFLGLEIDTTLAAAFLPELRAQQLVLCCQRFMRVGQYQSIKMFLRLLGLMAATLLAVPYARLYMRPIQLYMNQNRDAKIHSLSHKIMIPCKLVPVFRWWASMSNLTQGLPWNPPSPSVTLTTDASLKAWGGHLGDLRVQGRWTPLQSLNHINVLEMLAVFKALKAFQVTHQTVLVQTDNTTVISYINKAGGTKSLQLCHLTWDLFAWCREHQVQLQAVHIPGTMNVVADRLSRHLASPTEWELNTQVVSKLFQLWGTPQMDLFATDQNKKLPLFCSLFPHSQAFHQDALALSWNRLFGYAFPPLAILNQVVRKIAREGCTIVLIAPMWTRREWYPLLLDLLVDYPYQLPVMRNLVTQDRGELVHHNPAELCLVAWLLSGIRSLREVFQRQLLTHVLPPKAKVPKEHTSLAGTIFVPGVNREVSIPILPLLLP
jgi:ribonuclease HI